MSKFKKILVALDGSKNSFRALAKAIEIAKETKASITSISVIQTYRTEMGVVKTFAGNAISKNYKSFVNKAKTRCKKNNISFFDIIQYGQEGKAIVSFAEKNKFDMIVIGSRGRGILKGSFLGSTSNYIVHSTKIPVLIVK